VVPRYQSELGFIDIIGGAKVMVEDPANMMDEIRKIYQRMSVEGK